MAEWMTKKADRQKILSTHPHLADFLPHLDNLNKESERGAVVLSCSFVEDQLRNIILAFLVSGEEATELVEGYNAPLGSFAARASAACALGLISKTEHEEITTLRKIRNVFAHDFRITFADKKIIALCKKLKFSAKDYEDVVVGSFSQFSTAAVALTLSLTNRENRVSKKRLSPGDWQY
jgi:DNA-binding MltR family transcriptional regulator